MSNNLILNLITPADWFDGDNKLKGKYALVPKNKKAVSSEDYKFFPDRSEMFAFLAKDDTDTFYDQWKWNNGQYRLVQEDKGTGDMRELSQLYTKGDWPAYAKKYFEVTKFDPTKVKWDLIRFQSFDPDSRPVFYPAPGPWWETSIGDDYVTIVAYVPQGIDLKRYWPEAGNVDVMEEDTTISYSERRAKPKWWPFD